MSKLPRDIEVHSLALLAADLDDESPEVIALVCEHALVLGALDAVCIPVIMKKGRGGTRIELLCELEAANRLTALLLRETRTLGVRRSEVQRTALARREETVTVEGHPVRMKIALWDGRPLKAKPEFEDCRKISDALHWPVRDVMSRALKQWRETMAVEEELE